MTATAATEQMPNASGFLLCHSCHKLLPAEYTTQTGHDRCPRCGHSLRPRKKNSIARTWALLLTACLLTVPANLLPIMEVESFGVPDRSTIMDGILYFFREGSYGIGLVIFIASVLVPLFKIIGLIIILLSIHFHWHSWLRHKAIMFRYIEFIGRWSMLDIFVITLLCALAQFGFLSSINAAPAAFYFTGVVLSTMFAALSFDPRLLWDAAAVAPDQQ
jgi:paraquat-inducible protein A